MDEQERKELQVQFEKQTGTKVINSDGEFDIDYVAWLEEKVCQCSSEQGELVETLNDLWLESDPYGGFYLGERKEKIIEKLINKKRKKE